MPIAGESPRHRIIPKEDAPSGGARESHVRQPTDMVFVSIHDQANLGTPRPPRLEADTPVYSHPSGSRHQTVL